MIRYIVMPVMLATVLASPVFCEESTRPHAGMLRYPDVSAEHIVFVYANDVWVVPREGGLASPLASPPGQELFPRFSPDGQSIAFIGNYDGDRDVYTASIYGGAPVRVTHHPANEMMCDWTPQNKLLFFSNALAGLSRQEQLFLVDPQGGLPEKLPVPYGANGSIDGSGEWLAYTPFTRDFRTWKRYRGGWATDIWLFNLTDFSSEKITDWEGTDTYPMWYGDKVYYLSDAGPHHRLNIWSYNTTSKEREQITEFKDFDCKFPAAGPGENGEGEIVFQNGTNLFLLNLSSGEARSVVVMIPGARPKIRPQRIQVNDRIGDWSISSTGQRIVVEARGDIWTLPAKEGAVLNLTRSDDAAERDPQWSPDGKWIAYFSDASGEYELYIQQSDGKDKAKQLTSGGKAFRMSPVWSPDSKHIAFIDKTGAMYIHTIQSQKTRFVDKDPWAR
ncbi:MAG: S41 family peptidase, partial [Candidatus Hinthialibacter sp.]